MPTIRAILLGAVGRHGFDTRQGRDQTFNSAGNVTAAVLMGLIGYFIANRGIFFFVAALSVPTLLTLRLIRPNEVDYELASWSGRKAGSSGREPLLLLAFGVLPVRRALYTLTHGTPLLIGIQLLDGVGAGIFGVVSVLVIADLTRATGRFNLTLGAVSTAVGIGASLSQVLAGGIVHRLGYRAGFPFLAAVAAAGFAILFFFMPETCDARLSSAAALRSATT